MSQATLVAPPAGLPSIFALPIELTIDNIVNSVGNLVDSSLAWMEN
jgi:hypothetical protein